MDLFIPKGSEIWTDDEKSEIPKHKYLSTLKRSLTKGDIISVKDFEPELENGIKINPMIFKFKGEIIYIHPYFTDKCYEIVKPEHYE